MARGRPASQADVRMKNRAREMGLKVPKRRTRTKRYSSDPSRPQLSGPVKKRSGIGSQYRQTLPGSTPQRVSDQGGQMQPQISPEKPGAGGGLPQPSSVRPPSDALASQPQAGPHNAPGGGAAGQGQLIPAQQQPPQPLDVVTSAKQVGGRIGPDNTLRNRRIGFKGAGKDYGAGNLLSSVISGNELDRSALLKSHFESIIPMMEEERMRRMDGLMGKTAAMGRTGSGMFNTDVGNLELATRRGRDSLLGRLAAQAAGQEIQDRLGAAGQATQLRGQNLQESGMQARHLQAERNYEDRLARQAMADEARRLGFLQSQMNRFDPRQAMMQNAGMQMQGSGRYGANAAQLGSQLSQQTQAMMQSQGAGGGGILDYIGPAVEGLLGGGGGMPVSAPTGSPYQGAEMNLERVPTPTFTPPTLG